MRTAIVFGAGAVTGLVGLAVSMSYVPPVRKGLAKFGTFLIMDAMKNNPEAEAEIYRIATEIINLRDEHEKN
jgi:hypothetical protein